jgi:hypothetical protein
MVPLLIRFRTCNPSKFSELVLASTLDPFHDLVGVIEDFAKGLYRICSCAMLEKGKKGIGNSVEISLRRQIKSEKSLFWSCEIIEKLVKKIKNSKVITRSQDWFRLILIPFGLFWSCGDH